MNSRSKSSGQILAIVSAPSFDNNVFGFSGRPSSGRSDLANVVEGNVDWRPNPSITMTFYAAHANGGGVVRGIFPGDKANFLYLELVRRF